MKRYNCIDILRGFCMIWIVWYHTNHPPFVDYPFFNATLFFVSGILFKEYPWKLFFKKKFNQLIVPFCFFYIIYYFFLVALNYAKYHYVSDDILYSIFGVFGLYTYNEAFIVNYPLWFVLALFVIQLISNCLLKVISSRHLLFLISIVLSCIGYYYIQSIPTPFMFGRSLPYLVFFMAGFCYGKIMLEKRENLFYIIGFLFLWILLCGLRLYFGKTLLLIHYSEILSFAFFLLYISKILSSNIIVRPIIFYGINSFVLFGLHDMILTILRIVYGNVIGEMNIISGILSVVLTLLIVWPLTLVLNKYFPFFVGKRNMIK